MNKYVKALVAASFAILPVSAFAQGFDSTQYAKTPSQTVQPGMTKNFGTQLSLTTSATSGAANWGFWSKYVSICIPSVGGSSKVLARFGQALTASAGAQAADPFQVMATSTTIFESGIAGGLGGQAMVFSSPQSSSYEVCRTFPFQTKGLVFATAGQATVNVNAFAD